MTTQDERIIAEAFDRHVRELHHSQFEVCHDPGCAAAMWIEESAQCYPAPQFDPWFVEEPVEATK